jgi:hypothetical protein
LPARHSLSHGHMTGGAQDGPPLADVSMHQ